MKKQTLKKGLAAVLGLALCMQMPSVNSALQLSAYAQERAATINASSLNVRSGAGTSYSSVGKLGKGCLLYTSVQGRGCGTHGCAHEAGGNAGASAVAPGNRAQAGGKCHTVDVSLRGNGPADLSAVELSLIHICKSSTEALRGAEFKKRRDV